MTEEYKQAILIRTDLDMSKGKIAAQCAHAAVDAVIRVLEVDRLFKSDIFKSWKRQGMKKVILKVSGKEELFKFKSAAEREGLKVAIIKDAGMTELPPGTYTALAIGPAREDKVDKVTGKLSAL